MDIVNTVADQTYYRLTFTDIEDGAALVAAVSRFLASPQGVGNEAAPYEVSAECNAESSELHLYLSSAALDAVVQGFGTPAGVVAFRADHLPASRVLLLGHHDRQAHGRDDIMRRITCAAADKELR